MKVIQKGLHIAVFGSLLTLAACSGMTNSEEVAEQSNNTVPGPVDAQVAQAAQTMGAEDDFGVPYAQFGPASFAEEAPANAASQAQQAQSEKDNTIYFGFDSTSINQHFMNVINKNAHYLKSHPMAKLRLEGHTDPRGSREYNIGLGQRRGQSVFDQIQMMGINPDQLVVVSYGKEKLARDGNTPEDYRLDRRVEMVYENAG